MSYPIQHVLIAEFAQDEGPVCRFGLGMDPMELGIDIDAFVLRIMSVDVAHVEDWTSYLEIGHLRAFVLHTALVDFQVQALQFAATI